LKKAFIVGITGQDGSYLAEFLLAKGYEVHGVVRRTSTFNTDRLDHIYAEPQENSALHLHYGDLANGAPLRRLIEQIQPDEVYNLGAQSHVRVSFDQAEYTADVVATGALRLLEAFRGLCPCQRVPSAFLSGRILGDVRRLGPAAKRGHGFLSAQPLRGQQSSRALVRGQFPRSLRLVCIQWHSVQPRIAAARRDFRHAQDHSRPGPHPPGLPGQALSWESLCAPRLGPRGGLRARHVADPAASRARRLRDSHGREPLRARIPGSGCLARRGGLAVARRNRHALSPAHRGRSPAG